MYFHSLFKIFPNSPKVVIKGVHAPTKRGEKNYLWKELKDNPYLRILFGWWWGDLNEVVDQSEKMGGIKVTQIQGKNMESWMDSAGLMDLKYKGPNYTWSNC